jgi:hypothetical protein
MHFAFIPYGKRSEVELLLRDMEAQKHALIMRKDGKESSIYIQGQVRLLPLGVYEYIFPREDMDVVLNTLIEDKNRYGINRLVVKFLKTFYKLESIPDYKTDKHFLWIKDNVNIIPLGIRKDLDRIEEKEREYAGYEHEAI